MADQLIVLTREQYISDLEHASTTALQAFWAEIKGTSNDKTMVQPEVNGFIAKRMLKEKGYHCKSPQAFKAILKGNKIAGTKRGKEIWYNTELINKIPGRF